MYSEIKQAIFEMKEFAPEDIEYLVPGSASYLPEFERIGIIRKEGEKYRVANY